VNRRAFLGALAALAGPLPADLGLGGISGAATALGAGGGPILALHPALAGSYRAGEIGHVYGFRFLVTPMVTTSIGSRFLRRRGRATDGYRRLPPGSF